MLRLLAEDGAEATAPIEAGEALSDEAPADAAPAEAPAAVELPAEAEAAVPAVPAEPVARPAHDMAAHDMLPASSAISVVR